MQTDSRGQKTTIKTILLATDFLPNSRLAVDYAAVFAHRFHAHLIMAHAFEFGPHGKTVEVVSHMPCRERREAEARVRAFAQNLQNVGISAEWAVEEGPVPPTILQRGSHLKADLLVIGTQGVHRGIGHLLIGSNTEALMLGAPCPTLTIGPYVHGGINPDGSFDRLLCLSDFTPASAKAAAYAYGLAQDFGAPVELFQLPPDFARSDPQQLNQLAREYCAALASYKPEIEEEWCTPEFQLARVITPEEIRRQAMDSQTLMIMGVQPASFLGRHLHVSLPYRLLAEAACPILTVPCCK